MQKALKEDQELVILLTTGALAGQRLLTPYHDHLMRLTSSASYLPPDANSRLGCRPRLAQP